MIRSSRVSLKFSNTGKLTSLREFIDEYRRLTSVFIDELWDMEKVPRLLPKEVTRKPDTWLSARVRQSSAKQASGIVRGTRRKHKKRLWKIQDFKDKGMFKKARILQGKHDERTVSRPNVRDVNPEMDSRFVDIDLDNGTSFDGWLTLSSLGNKFKIQLPFKRNRHLNRMLRNGKMRGGARVSRDSVTLMFDLRPLDNPKQGKVLGIDIGLKNTISCSNSHVSKPNKHGHDLGSITRILSKRKKGGKGFERATRHRKDYVNWSVNQLNLENVKQVNLENIKHIRRGRRTNRLMGHWTYTDIFGKLERYCEERGVLVRKVNPTYTSQRCSGCGWVRKGNRVGKLFKCDKCSMGMDSDLNASRNLALDLRPIGRKERLSGKNRIGFYWNQAGQESIVPDAKKPKLSCFS